MIEMATVTLKVEGMSCNHCKEAVEGALKKLPGVKNAVVDLGAKTATVTYEEEAVSVDQMKEAVEDQGYDVV
jgi:copper chaperone